VITRNDLTKWLEDSHPASEKLRDVSKGPIVAYPDEPLRVVVYRMAETGLTRFPVVERGDARKLMGMIALFDLLSARTRNLAEERDRERVLRIRLPSLGGEERRVVEKAP
jgi:CBS domain-containing protein